MRWDESGLRPSTWCRFSAARLLRDRALIAQWRQRRRVAVRVAGQTGQPDHRSDMPICGRRCRRQRATSDKPTAAMASLSLSAASALHCSSVAPGLASKAVALSMGLNNSDVPLRGTIIERAVTTQILSAA